MSVPDVEYIETRERSILDGLPGLEARHVPRDECGDYDAVLVEPFRSSPPLWLFELLELAPGTPLELKTCKRWIDDAGSRGGRRRGQYKVNETTHGRLVELGGAYVFCVLDGAEGLLGGLVVPAENVDSFSWHKSGSRYASRRATVSWPTVVPRGLLP